VKRIIVAIASVMTLITFSITLGGAAWSATTAPSTAVITFDDAAQQVTLQIPSPACPASQPTCQWKFFLNEPKLSVDVATVFGTSGTLTLAYPPNFCGVIQADAYVGPPWVAKRGFQHTIEDCEPPTTTTTTTEPPTTTTTTTTTTLPPVPPPISGPTVEPPTPAPVAVPVAAPAPVPAAPAPITQLPFTGKNMTPFLVVGLALVVFGLALLAPDEYWRRASRRWSAILPRRLRGRGGSGGAGMVTRMRAVASVVACSSYGP
jgi:hypothetical protein